MNFGFYLYRGLVVKRLGVLRTYLRGGGGFPSGGFVHCVGEVVVWGFLWVLLDVDLHSSSPTDRHFKNQFETPSI